MRIPYLRKHTTPLLGLPCSTTGRTLVLGIPYDSGQTFQTGSRFFPIFIRISSSSIEEFSLIFERDVRKCDVTDAGDVDVSFGDFFETKRRVGIVLGALDSYNRKFVFLGGDHSITIMTVSALRKKIRFYIHIDAHADFEDSYLGSRFNHDTVLRRVGEILGWERIALIGVRSMSEKAMRSLRDLNVEFYTSMDVMENPSILEDLTRKADYISFDVDVLDPSIAPEVGNPEPMGLTLNQIIRTVKRWNNRYFDIVEGVPRDPGSITAITAATLLREVLIRMSCML